MSAFALETRPGEPLRNFLRVLHLDVDAQSHDSSVCLCDLPWTHELAVCTWVLPLKTVHACVGATHDVFSYAKQGQSGRDSTQTPNECSELWQFNFKCDIGGVSTGLRRRHTHRGARTHDHKVKSLALYRLS